MKKQEEKTISSSQALMKARSMEACNVAGRMMTKVHREVCLIHHGMLSWKMIKTLSSHKQKRVYRT